MAHGFDDACVFDAGLLGGFRQPALSARGLALCNHRDRDIRGHPADGVRSPGISPSTEHRPFLGHGWPLQCGCWSNVIHIRLQGPLGIASCHFSDASTAPCNVRVHVAMVLPCLTSISLHSTLMILQKAICRNTRDARCILMLDDWRMAILRASGYMGIYVHQVSSTLWCAVVHTQICLSICSQISLID